MQEDSRASLKAGAVSSLPFTVYFLVRILPRAWVSLTSTLVKFPILAPHENTILLVNSFMLAIAYLVLALLFGAIAGFMFVVSLNKLPVRSTYVKAVGASLLVWILLVLVPAFLYRLSISVIIVDARALLPQLGLFVFDAFIFSYLFGRWRNLTNPGTQILD